MGKAKTKPKMIEQDRAGYEGAVVSLVNVRLSATRTEKRSVRARPGTFEWRYGRASADGALYHAGVKFAELWEKAGTADAKSIDYMREGHSAWKGLPDGRAVAVEEVGHAMRELGKLCSSRLMAYCVQGETTAQLAERFGVPDRDMAAVLHQDLRAAAFHFRFL